MRISEDANLRDTDMSQFPVCAAFDIEFDLAADFPVPKFIDRSLGLEIEYSWWAKDVDQTGLMVESDIPLGSADNPHWDRDQGWHILIWCVAGMVYIAQGGEYDDVYENCAAVSRSQYLAAWNRVISAAASEAPPR